MDILKIGSYYNIKNDNDYLPGKYESESVAEMAVSKQPGLDLNSVWIYTLWRGADAISEEDIEVFTS